MAAMGHSASTELRRHLATALADAGEPGAGLPGPVAPARHGHSPRFGDALAAEVISRLTLAHAARPSGLALADAQPADALAAMLLRHDAASAAAYAEALLQAGRPAEDLCLGLLAPAARLLGRFWAEDVCDFATVTLGLMALRRIRESIAPQMRQEAVRWRGAGPSALLVPVPGEQHVFGLEMVADFFRRAGWQVQILPIRAVGDLTGMLRRYPVDILGLSLGATQRMDLLATIIRKARQASCRQGMGVMVGGAAFDDHPECAVLIGADATAADARQAPLQAARLLRLLAQRD